MLFMFMIKMDTRLVGVICYISICTAVVDCRSPSYKKFARCLVRPNTATPDLEDKVQGTVYFEQEFGSDKVKVDVDLSGFSPSDDNIKHGFHVHAIGDISGGCGSAGGHFNPFGVTHGAPAAGLRHVGDLGNIVEDLEGNVKTVIKDSYISLRPGYTQIIGKSIVIHEKADDLGLGGDVGSLATGNAGPRLACCVIEEATGEQGPDTILAFMNRFYSYLKGKARYLY